MVIVDKMDIAVVGLRQTAHAARAPDVAGKGEVEHHFVVADPAAAASIGVGIAAVGVVEVVEGVGGPVADLAVEGSVLGVYQRAVVYPYVFSLVGDQVDTVDVNGTGAYQREVADDDVLAALLDAEDAGLVGQGVDTRLLVLQLHHGLLGEEGTLVAGQCCAVRQCARVLVGAAQPVQVLGFQVRMVIGCQEELCAEAGVVDTNERLVLR